MIPSILSRINTNNRHCVVENLSNQHSDITKCERCWFKSITKANMKLLLGEHFDDIRVCNEVISDVMKKRL